jgi:hypothetical protein
MPNELRNYEGFEEYDPTSLGESSGKGCFFSFVFMMIFFVLAVILECSSWTSFFMRNQSFPFPKVRMIERPAMSSGLWSYPHLFGWIGL